MDTHTIELNEQQVATLAYFVQTLVDDPYLGNSDKEILSGIIRKLDDIKV